MKFPLTYGLQETGLPLIVTSGKLKDMCFLIDTGATHNIIFSFVYEHLKDEFVLLKKKQSSMGIEGNFQEWPTIKATLNFEGTEFTSTFTVLDATKAITQVQQQTGIQIHGILGTSFLLENKWVIDYNNLIVSSHESE